MNPFTHILILEDDDQLSRMYEKILQHANFKTRRFSQIEQAIQHIPRFDPDIIVLDWHLDNHTSAPFLEHLRGLPYESLPQIALISGKKVAVNGYSDLIATTLLKPVSVSQLVKEMQHLQGLAEARQPYQQIEGQFLSPGILEVGWHGHVTGEFLANNPVPEMGSAHTLIFNLQNLCAARFTMQALAGDCSTLFHLKQIHVVYDVEELTLAQSIMRHFNFPAEVFYYTDPDDAYAAVMQV